MPDYAFILCFASMLIAPCLVAFHNARNGKEVSATDAEAGNVFYLQTANGSNLTRAELAAQRNRELYLRSMR